METNIEIIEKDGHVFVEGNTHSGKTAELVNLACGQSQFGRVLFLTLEELPVEIMDRIMFENDDKNKIVHNIIVSSMKDLRDLEEMLLLNNYKHIFIDALYLLPYRTPSNIFKDTIKLLDKYDAKGYFTSQTSSTTF